MSRVVLGKGLGALIPGEGSDDMGKANYRLVSLDELAPNPMQPRHEFDAEELASLAESFKQNGVLQPLLVKKNSTGYTIIAGERRYRAARLADLKEVPVLILDDISDSGMLELALVENIHRQDLNPIETAQAFRRLIDDCALTQNELAVRVGRSRAAVANQLRLLSLPARIQDMIRSGLLSEGHARAILALDSEESMLALAEKIVGDSLSVRTVEEQVRRRKRGRRAVRRNPPAIVEIENSLKQILGTAVRIAPGPKRGRIEIEYYGEDDLGRLWELFRKIQ
ncbi:MAG: ParB/RepB/Spo0J family partition protein [Candidatus Zixiibacteriota bacterium]|nr:MAG: ParB/RepB/Spo0J family partition protein [candidate division Zixibacteria bacterium]